MVMLRKVLSMLLAEVLVVSLLLPVRAAELPEAAVPAEPAATETAASASVTETTEATEMTEMTVATLCTAETAETEAATEPEEPPAPAKAAELPYNLYFGLLHAHTDISDGIGSVEEAFCHAAQVEGLDFFAVTDHSNSFDNANAGDIALDGAAVSTEWAAGKAAAAAVTNEDFVGIFGYEMTWQEGKHIGHINTFNTPGWESRNQEAYAHQPTALETYYKALTAVPGSISQFNHPGTFYGEFENFGHYSAEYDEMLHLLEVGGEGDFTAYEYYTKALDAGWHVAPSNNQNNHNGLWGDANSARTVVLADTLTEQSLYDAIRQHRVYATEDCDLRICYELDGHIMGSILSSADSPEITVYLEDPTDAAVGRIEVIGDGGAVIAAQTVETAQETVTIHAPAGYSYYYLRITQPDGDIAVTAPVWVESYEDLGISGFSTETQVPVQGKALTLTLDLFNDERVDLTLTTIAVSVNGTAVHTEETPGTVQALDTFTYTIPYTHSGLGTADITATVTGTIAGERRTWEETLTLHFRSGEMVSGILVDGSHGNAGIGELENFAAIAEKVNMEVTVFTEEMPMGGELLVITAPEHPLEDRFLDYVKEFVQNGGSLILCGTAGDNAQLNRLLEAVDSSLRLNNGTAIDEVNNGGTPDALSTTIYNTACKWCGHLTAEQFYSHHAGCTVDPGSGTWLVKDLSGIQVLLACEDTAFGGTVFAAGCPFLTDSEMPEPSNRWDPPRANQTILETILGAEQTALSLCDIWDVRTGEPGEVYRVKGYVTAGTSKKANTFPKTIYIQDDTGGIAITAFTDTGIQIGSPIEIIGYLSEENGNPVLELMDYQLPDEDHYRYTPKTKSNKTAMDYDTYGGELMQIEGEVVSLTKTADGKGISRLELKDIRGHKAIVEIESAIRSGSTGKNTLATDIKKGRTVRAMGILHLNEDGETVLRVRNCDEVVYVPPTADPTNPKTGDPFSWLWRIEKELQ